MKSEKNEPHRAGRLAKLLFSVVWNVSTYTSSAQFVSAAGFYADATAHGHPISWTDANRKVEEAVVKYVKIAGGWISGGKR